ncbi:helicase [Phormidium sp. LEGE 05292]|uniref:helicase-related protein n=1 Tax=[Phormidium] sp. LEGE 05292 TaxID=767427 RepID=UPI001880283A|nr:helicase-related protein [Phormidium sp. LEGE 05292]MBE9224784.1 helicase [Phormidium sp. LEGE 05292]
MALPDYIDNNQHTLEDVLRSLILDESQTNLDIATGFFRIEAWARLEQELNTVTSLRLLIGRDPTIRPAESDRIDLIRYFRRDIQQQLETENFKLKYKQQIDRLIAYLQQDHIQIRLYGIVGDAIQFLHAKAYIFDNYSIIGSSNFTPAGLSGNTELNVLNKTKYVAQDLRHNWFEKFWNDKSVDKNYKVKLIDALNASKFGSKPYTPYQVFLKALYELFKEDTLAEGSVRTSLELASFQQEGFERAVRLLERHRGCIVADAVGLGKTYIGLRVLDHYLIKDKRPGYVPRALVICPAQLRDLVWLKKLDEFGIKADVISQEEISRTTFDTRRYNKHDIIVVDESHNFRNSATNRYRNLQKLIGSGQRNKRVLLLTATPINTSIYDLYHQIFLLARNTETYYREWGIPHLKTYFKALAKGGAEITELLLQTIVRRSRQDVIKRQLAGEEIYIAGQKIRFPKRSLKQFTYNFEASFQGLYVGISNQIDQLHLAPYNIKAFKQRKTKKDEDEVKCNDALVALMKSLYLKRLESSVIAFRNSIRNQRNFQEQFYMLLQQGKLLDSNNFRKIIAAEIDEEESSSVEQLIQSLDKIDPNDYQIDQLCSQIQSDLNILNGILNKLDKIQNDVELGRDYDRKLATFKQLLVTELKGQKILVFSYFKDTTDYLYNQLLLDEDWLKKMAINERQPKIDKITGETPGKQREEKVKRFAPKANCENESEQQNLLSQEIDILICTDVLSEGQNLQDAGVLVNYDLHWNPVRMIQRAGRIDRLGTNYEELFIYNCFPEEGLEALLGLVARLQARIAMIDKEVGLDASVLGEIISEKSLEELYRLKKAITDADKEAILEELEQAADLVSLDEMRLPLLEFFKQEGEEAAEEIPLGIHSTRYLSIPEFETGGIFLAFRAKDKHFWHFYPRVNGVISIDSNKLTSDKRKIFNWLKCKAENFPHPEQLLPVKFDNSIFDVLDKAISNLMTYFKKQRTSRQLKPQLTKLLQKVYHALTQISLSQEEPIYKEAKERVLKVITTINLRIYERDIKAIWEKYVLSKDLNALVSELDELFVEQDQYYELDEEELDPLEMIKEEDIQLVCYQWFNLE